jgi:hypothetical protein
MCYSSGTTGRRVKLKEILREHAIIPLSSEDEDDLDPLLVPELVPPFFPLF